MSRLKPISLRGFFRRAEALRFRPKAKTEADGQVWYQSVVWWRLGCSKRKEKIQAFGREVAPSAWLVFGPTEVGPFRLWLPLGSCFRWGTGNCRGKATATAKAKKKAKTKADPSLRSRMTMFRGRGSLGSGKGDDVFWRRMTAFRVGRVTMFPAEG